MSVFAVGAGVAAYEGVDHLRHPSAIGRPEIVFIVLGLASLFEGTSWIIAMKEFRARQASLSWWAAFRRSKDPRLFMTLFEDSASPAGILVAAAGVGLSIVTGDPRWDGGASLVISGILVVVALLLARESKGLLIGERADPALTAAIMSLAREIDGVGGVNGVATIHLAPEQVVAYFSVAFDDGLRTPEIEAAVKALEERLRARARRCWRSSLNRKPRTRRGRGSPSVARGSPPTPDGNAGVLRGRRHRLFVQVCDAGTVP